VDRRLGDDEVKNPHQCRHDGQEEQKKLHRYPAAAIALVVSAGSR
jgi:hypothetical protein